MGRLLILLFFTAFSLVLVGLVVFIISRVVMSVSRNWENSPSQKNTQNFLSKFKTKVFHITRPNAVQIERFNVAFDEKYGKDVYDFQKKHQDPLISKTVNFLNNSFSDNSSYGFNKTVSKTQSMIFYYYLHLSKEVFLDVPLKFQPLLLSCIEVLEEHQSKGLNPSQEVTDYIHQVFKDFSDELNERIESKKNLVESEKKRLQEIETVTSLEKIQAEKELLDKMNQIKQPFKIN